jgi:hypothetical protein
MLVGAKELLDELRSFRLPLLRFVRRWNKPSDDVQEGLDYKVVYAESDITSTTQRNTCPLTGRLRNR